jgi:exonuclease SbcC
VIPTRLTLRNFLSYGEACPPLELDGIGLACLSGANGHGKSSLIDAITWALWGRARGKDLDALVHHGRRDMEVDLEFLASDQRYRVIRRRQRVGARGPSRPSLELQLRAGEEWRPLTEPTIAQTERAIERLLRLSYETFVNSALLLQGKADLFSAAGPASRKRVLAEILELSAYEALELRARDERKRYADEAAEMDRTLSLIAPKIAELPALELEQAGVRTELTGVLAALDQAGLELSGLQAAHAAIAGQRDALHELDTLCDEDERAIAATDQEIAELRASLVACEPVVAAAPAILAGYGRLQRAREEERDWSEKLRRVQEIEQAMIPHQQALARADARLQEQRTLLRARLDEARSAARERVSLKRRLVELESRNSSVVSLDAEACGAGRRLSEYRSSLALMTAELEQLRAALERIAGQLDGPLGIENGQVLCPTCRSPLDAEGVERLKEHLLAERRDCNARMTATAVQIEVAEQEIERLIRAESEHRSRVEFEQHRLFEDRISTRLRLELAEQAHRQAKALSLELHDLNETQRDEAGPEDHLGRLANERTSLGYDARRHRDAVRAVERYQEYESRYHGLTLAQSRYDDGCRALRRHEALRAGMQERLTANEQRRMALRRAVADQPDVSDAIQRTHAHIAELERRRSTLEREIGRLDERIAECRAARAREGDTRVRLQSARELESIHADLTAAFGRKGVQAFVMDSALPEMEVEANRLLGVMTEGRMSVRLETQRETRAGELAETLDIVVADEWGSRDYEMYSGGEAFRIDLALRIALSRLLVRRAGAPLPTLIIDEGFGSQDEGGRDRLVEALGAIKDDFRCLLVVTHIDELKQLFDIRIEVSKGECGSVARVVRV